MEAFKSFFHTRFSERDFSPDANQLAAVELLGEIAAAVSSARPPRRQGILQRLLRTPAPPTVTTTGAYLWGDVGRGKTLLVDIFYDALPFPEKRRIHFHSFMREVHQSLQALGRRQNPLSLVVARWREEVRVLCLDEFHVSDITDAMILARLLEGLFNAGITLITTSNEAPERLYHNGLQRQRFLPAITLLQRHLHVFEFTGAIDYRLRALAQATVYHYPHDALAERKLADSFVRLATERGVADTTVEVEGRCLPVLRLAEGVVWFDFEALCAGPTATADFIEIARCYHTVLISNIPVLTGDDDAAARRFINLVDEFYDRGVNLIVSAAQAPAELYSGCRLAAPFRRTISRLQEMRSHAYLASPHVSD